MHPRWSAPFYWAGFVLPGGVAVALEVKRGGSCEVIQNMEPALGLEPRTC